MKSTYLHKVRRNSYLVADGSSVGDREHAHRALVFDVALQVGRAAIVSHVSAAVLHGLELPSDLELGAVHLTWPGAAGRGTSTNIHPHRALIEPEDVVLLAGIPVTGVARTIYDLARSQDQVLSVAVADGALRDRLCSREDFTATLDRTTARPGSSRAWQVMAFADERSAGVTQSRTRVILARIGIPPPEVGAVLEHPRFGQIGPLDFLLRELGTILSCDESASGGRCPGREPLTEVVRNLGCQMVWIGGADLNEPLTLLRMLKAAAVAAGRRWHRHPPVLLATTVAVQRSASRMFHSLEHVLAEQDLDE